MCSYGGIYNTRPQILVLALGVQCQIPMPSVMPLNNIKPTHSNGLMVKRAGTYEINYNLIGSISVAVALSLAIRVNGVDIPSAEINRLVAVNTESIFHGSVIVDLEAGAVVDMAIFALVAATVTLGTGVNATLTLKQLS